MSKNPLFDGLGSVFYAQLGERFFQAFCEDFGDPLLQDPWDAYQQKFGEIEVDDKELMNLILGALSLGIKIGDTWPRQELKDYLEN